MNNILIFFGKSQAQYLFLLISDNLRFSNGRKPQMITIDVRKHQYVLNGRLVTIYTKIGSN